MKPYQRKDGAWLLTWNGKQHYLNKGPEYDTAKLTKLTGGQQNKTRNSLKLSDLSSKYLTSLEGIQSADSIYKLMTYDLDAGATPDTSENEKRAKTDGLSTRSLPFDIPLENLLRERPRGNLLNDLGEYRIGLPSGPEAVRAGL